MRTALFRLSCAAAAVAICWAAPANAAGPTIDEAGKPAFPTRTYTLGTTSPLTLGAEDVTVHENGTEVDGLTIQGPGGRSGDAFGSVLVIDASRSMKGQPIVAAMRAARAFAGHRIGDQQLGVVTFSGTLDVAVPLTSDAAQIDGALSSDPALGPKTHLYDAVDAASAMLANSGVQSRSIVVLSDGADSGSVASLGDVTGRAEGEGIRIFVVGLRSKRFDPTTLESLAVGGAFAEASEAKDLAPILDRFGAQAASEHLLRYRSAAEMGSRVEVEVEVAGVAGVATDIYRTPAQAAAAAEDGGFWASTAAMIGAIVLVAGLLGIALFALLRPHPESARERLARFLPGRPGPAGRPGATAEPGPLTSLDDALRGREWWGSFQETLQIADIGTSATRIAVTTLTATVFVAFLISQLFEAPVLLPLALLAPFAVRIWILRALNGRRHEFAEQLADNLQLVASALRAGQSMAGALAVVVEEAEEPARGEFRRIVKDERLGVPLEDAIRDVARRMDNSELEQVALVATIQRETGGNTAEVLDQVIATIRERAKLRRLMETLTSQGRLAQVIVSALPLVLLVAIAVINRDYLEPLLDESSGRIWLAVAAVLSVIGSLVLKRIVEVRA